MTKMSKGVDENVKGGVDENVKHNNKTILNNNTVIDFPTQKENAPEILFQPKSENTEPDAIFARALEAATAYIKDDNGVLELVRDASLVSVSDMGNTKLLEEMREWVRWNSTDLGFPKEAAHRLLYGKSSFVSWMRKWKEIQSKKKPVTNGTNRNNQSAADRERQRAAGAFAARDQILREHGIDPSNYAGDY